MKLNVAILNKDDLLVPKKIDSKDLDSKVHKHISGRDFTNEEVKTIKWMKEVVVDKK